MKKKQSSPSENETFIVKVSFSGELTHAQRDQVGAQILFALRRTTEEVGLLPEGMEEHVETISVQIEGGRYHYSHCEAPE